LLSVNVLSNPISADFSFYYCVYSGLSQLSRIAPNNGDSHKSSMYQNVQTCNLEVKSDYLHLRLFIPSDYLYLNNKLPEAKCIRKCVNFICWNAFSVLNIRLLAQQWKVSFPP